MPRYSTRLATIGLALLAGLTMMWFRGASPAVAEASAQADIPSVTFCHATTTSTDPYRQVAYNHLVSDSGPVWIPGSPPGWGGIIPPFVYQGSYYSLNWNLAGQAIWDNDCNVPGFQYATTTNLGVSAATPSLNQTVTLTATVQHTQGNGDPTGTVDFYDGTQLLGSATLVNGVAQLTTTFGGGVHSITATYQGNATYLMSTSNEVTVTVGCAHVLTGTLSSVIATSGLTCVQDATITGGISVQPGASLDLENVTVGGSISAGSPAGMRICGSRTGAIAVSGATGFVRIGDPEGNCAGNEIAGGLTAANNRGGGTVTGNMITGSWLVVSNRPAFTVVDNVR
jgi:hypothetical protein